MLEEDTYWKYIDLWINHENHELIAKDFSAEPSWWVAAFAVDLYTRYGEEASVQFCQKLIELNKNEV